MPPRTPSKDISADFPRVDTATQKGRDITRRQILLDELATEEKALAEARNNLQAGAENPEIYTDKDGKIYRNVSKQEEKISALQEQVLNHEKNIAALNTELSKTNK
jgi:predicted RNase H-like nuclease (RuvC/YqgF family)